MWSKVAQVVLGFAVWFLALPGLMFVLGVPASLYLVAKQSRGLFGGWLVWLSASWVGWLPQFGGPAGMPIIVFWAGAVLFGAWFLFGFTIMSKAAWRHALQANRLMRDFGVPPQEIV